MLLFFCRYNLLILLKGTSSTPLKVVGDGGASWRARALRRAKESAAEEGKELDEVIKERFNVCDNYNTINTAILSILLLILLYT